MPTKRKHTVGIFPIETGNVSNQKQESDGPFQAKIKIHKQINKHSFSLITYLFFACLHVIESHSEEVFNLDELLKSEEFKGFPMIYSNINRRRIISSRCLSIYLFIIYKRLYAPQICFFLPANNSNSSYYIPFMKILDLYVRLIFSDSLFVILLNEFLIVVLNSINMGEKMRISFVFSQGEIDRKWLPSNENVPFVPNRDIDTNFMTTYNKKNKSNYISTSINKIKYKKKFSIRNKNHSRNLIKMIKYILLLNLLCNILANNKVNSIEYNSYSITLKIKGIGNKQIFSSDTSYFKSEYYPNEISINGYKQSIITHTYLFNQTNNYIELKWNDLISSCNCMFYGCSDITEIDFSNFKTSKVTNMQAMFQGCSSLVSLNLSNFDTSQVTWMQSMFRDCSSLTSLNLSNFDTSKVSMIYSMFDGCINLEYINMKNFNLISLNNDEYYDIFKNVPDNIVICINKNNILKIYPKIEDIKCRIEDCSNDWKAKQKKIIKDTNPCIDRCSDSDQYEYNGKCISECSNKKIYSDNDILKCKCELEKCLECPIVALNNHLCTKCNEKYYPMENDPLNIGDYINCYNEIPQGYYLDKNDLIYRKCYHSCETCYIKGNNEFHYCLKCKEQFNLEIHINEYINCYENCKYYYYFDNNNNYHCTQNLSCPKEYPILIEDKNECQIADVKNMENFIETLFKNDEGMGNEEEINNYNKILDNLESLFTSSNFNLTNIDKGEDQFLKTDKILITFTNLENQKNNIESNMSTIDLGECEDLLRKYYNLTNNETIYMKKLDISQDGMKAKKIEYDVYCQLSGNNLEKLNLTICENTKISINIPIEIVGNIDKFNASSGYFNDICYTSTSDDGTDITLRDRKKEFLEGDNIICQDGCNFSVYDSQYKKAKCECYAKESAPSYVDMVIDKNKFFESFIDFKNLVNIKIVICYKKLLSIKAFVYNIGCIIMTFIIFFHIITIFIFYISQLKKIKKSIQFITFAISNISLIKKISSKINNISNKKIIKNNSQKNKNKFESENKGILKLSKTNYLGNNYVTNKIKKITNIITENIININSSNRDISKLKINEQNKIKKIQKIMHYNTDEMNDLSYDLALYYDRRTFCKYYCSLLKLNHCLYNSFCNNKDYNSKIMKLDIFFIGISIDYTVNALFFNDDTMHKIYKNKGAFELASQIPIIIYSCLISMILNIPVSFLGLSNDNIINFKQNLKSSGISKRGEKLIFCLKLKFVLFFLMSSILLLCFWYYVSIFGVIYKNTQYHLLKDSVMSFGMAILSPLVVYLLPSILRIASLSNPKKKRKCLYNFSKIFQII